jgi:surface polysaccharide O-acyltransferase-like enzyme
MRNQTPAAARLAWLDALRLLAGVCIIGVHSSTDPAGNPFSDYPAAERIFPVLFRSLVYIARSELFLIISVFVLLMKLDGQSRPYPTVLREQARRILVPYAFWVVWYAFYSLIKAEQFGYSHAIVAQLQDLGAWFGYFFLGNVKYHLHYVPELFGVILLYPAYRLAVRRPELGVALVLFLWAKASIDAWLYSALASSHYLHYAVHIVNVLAYSGCGIVAGSLYGILKSNFSRETGGQILSMTLPFAAILIVIKMIYAYKAVTNGAWPYDFIAGYWADSMLTPVLFLAIMSVRHVPWPGYVSRLAPFSFGIYLVHPTVMDAIEILFKAWPLAPWQLVGLKFVLTLMGTSMLVFLISRVPSLRWTIGLGGRPEQSGAVQVHARA